MLSKKEAFKMILDKIFEDKSEDTFDLQGMVKDYLHTRLPVNEVIVDSPAEDTTITVEDTPDSVTLPEISLVKTKSKPKTSVKSTDRYIFPSSYKKQLNWILFDDGTVGFKNYKNGEFESYQILNIFEDCKIPFTHGEYSYNLGVIHSNDFTSLTGLKLLYNLQLELSRGCGDLLDIIYEIYCNKYDVPMYSLFGVQNNQITVNNVETGIKPFQLKQWIDEINGSVDFKGSICKIMREYTEGSKKYLFTLLKNYEDKSLLELL